MDELPDAKRAAVAPPKRHRLPEERVLEHASRGLRTLGRSPSLGAGWAPHGRQAWASVSRARPVPLTSPHRPSLMR